jgi:hypothetical protein
VSNPHGLELFVFHAVCSLFATPLSIPVAYAATFRSQLSEVTGPSNRRPVGFYRGCGGELGDLADVLHLVLGLTTTVVVLVGGWSHPPPLGAQPSIGSILRENPYASAVHAAA